MNRFSDRIGITQRPTELQINSMNDVLRNCLWNLIVTHVGNWSFLATGLYIHYFKEPIDSLPRFHINTQQANECRALIRKRFFDLEWYETYNLLECMIENYSIFTNGRMIVPGFLEAINPTLEQELSGYRLINEVFVPITHEQEVDAIGQASELPFPGLDGVSQHMKNALRLLGQKPNPDYRNSIKESISAVEGLCKKLTNKKSGGLDKAIEALSAKFTLHPALKSVFLKLYGYASDEDGIRHPILESKNIGFAEAKFMLVTCSAVVNFIVEKAHDAELL